GFEFGEGTFDTVFNDTWTWDGTDWVELATTPLACSGHAIAYDPTGAHLLLVGLCDDVNVMGLLEYPYDGAWQFPRDEKPPPRTPGAMVVTDDGRASCTAAVTWTSCAATRGC